MIHHKYSRRNFLGQLSCAAIGSNTLLNTIVNLNLVNTVVAKRALFNNDYKAMVCILMAGGADSFNMLVPKGDSEHAEYATVRGSLALGKDSLLPITPNTSDGKTYGLHPSLTRIKTLFDNGDLAFAANVGTLQTPTTMADYTIEKDLPLGLFSHSDQLRQWQTSLPSDRKTVGWGGKMADVLASMNENANISMNISLAGNSTFLSGNTTTNYVIHHKEDAFANVHGSTGIIVLDLDRADFIARKAGVQNVLSTEYENLLRIAYRNTLSTAQANHDEFSSAIKAVPNFANPIATDTFSFGNNLKMVAKTIASRAALNMNRQVFVVPFFGWDHHDEVLNNQTSMLNVLDKGLGEFHTVLEELGVADKVTTFSASEFGRTLTSNGNGSDHGWGGHSFVMGGAVNGKDIYGTYPDLFIGNSLDVGRGRLIPTMSTDEYFAELALWFGVEKSELSLVLPNIANFYNTANNTPPVGFMNMA